MTSIVKMRRDVANVLRHLNHPKRICSVTLVSAFFEDERHLGGDYGSRAAARIRKVIDLALRDLTDRQRTIVERCDLGGEMHKSVLHEVALSERQFYRDRAAAFDKLAAALLNPIPQNGALVNVSLDLTTASMALANVLFQAGHGTDATRLLQEIGTNVEDASTKSWIFSRLTEVSARLSLAKEAAAFADMAAQLASESGCGWVEAEAAVNAAYALRYSGREKDAATIALRVLPALRFCKGEAPAARRAEALGVATELIAERAIENGNAQGAIEICKEAQAALSEARSVRPSARCSVAYWYSIGTFFTPGAEASGADQMEKLFYDALDAGFTAEAGTIGDALAGFYRILGKPERALELLVRMRDTIRETCSGEALGGSLLELAAAYMELNQLAECYSYVDAARKCVAPGTFIFADSFLSEAKAAILRNEPLRALRTSHLAIEQFTVLGRPRLVGHALRYQALALDALGKREAALDAMTQCLDRLDAYAHVTVAARAHEEAARISGDRRRILAARKKAAAVVATMGRFG